MRIAVVGVGGVGGYFGGRLAQSGADVTFVARGGTLDALHKHGLRVDSLAGNFTVDPVQVAPGIEAVGEVDVVLVCVKSWQVEGIAPELKSITGPNTMVVPLLNCVEAVEQLAAVLGSGHVLGGLCGLISYIVEPGHICHAGAEPFVTFGELDNQSTLRTHNLEAVFARSIGVNAKVPRDIQVAMWSKFLLIASWSGVGSVTRSTVGVIRELPETRQLLIDAMQEIYQLGRTKGVVLPEDSVQKSLNFIDQIPSGNTASMQRDIMEGRRSELESQTDSVCRMARQLGVETPVNDFIYRCLLPQESSQTVGS